MKFLLITLFTSFVSLSSYSQYQSLIFEADEVNIDNKIYVEGNAFIFNYEIIINDTSFKLDSSEVRKHFLGESFSEQQSIEHIYLVVKPLTKAILIDESQTQISYYQGPQFDYASHTGAVENANNVWIHPIRDGFFKSLELCPFPYIKRPNKEGLSWCDSMEIGEGWRNNLWAQWEGPLSLKYDYSIVEEVNLDLEIGMVECWKVESTSRSKVGESKLVAYFSDIYGFVRLEYELVNGTRVNIWLEDFLRNQKFNETTVLFKTKTLFR